MDEAIERILAELRRGGRPDARWLDRTLRDVNRAAHDPDRSIAKKRLLPYYLRQKAERSQAWRAWGVTGQEDDAVVALLRAKPRRTASGVATLTVLMKPWPCGSDCVYCPNDVRMPKSYLSDEPACQRAERCFFDPYLQVAARMRVLSDMGHNVDKVELIVLGGTFSDYERPYRTWFVKELFRALNEFGAGEGNAECGRRAALYEQAGMRSDPGELAQGARDAQAAVDAGRLTYNAAVMERDAARRLPFQAADMECLEAEHEANEHAAHRVVGLVVETRPDAVTRGHLEELRRLGCTKVQIGLQSLTPETLRLNRRGAGLADIESAFELLREYGFKSHVHFMANLLGASPESDLADFRRLVSDPAFLPDEVKLYPCALVESARLMRSYEAGEWRPYECGELVDLLVECVMSTPAHTRISRMIRDISSKDIVAGNKKTNLRQLVERRVAERAEATGDRPVEMRMREIATSDVDVRALHMEEAAYPTSNTQEVFLQYVNDEGRLAGFLRLSLPHEGEHAMIREVHVYGRVSKLHENKEGAQHSGLGASLVRRACEIARQHGRSTVKVISAVGTREYYRCLGFHDGGLYQEMEL